MKHMTLKTISLIMVVVLLLGAFAGCVDDMLEKQTTPSKDVEGSNDEIANLTDADIDDLIGTSIKLSSEKEAELKQICATTYDFNIEEIQIDVKGEFNGAYAVMIKYPMSFPECSEIINGFEFAYNSEMPLKVVYEGKCYSLSEAVDQELINNLDLEILFWRFKKTTDLSILSTDVNFADNKILLIMMPSCNFKNYNPDDFIEINCIKVRDFSIKLTEGEICKALSLEIAEGSKQNVIDAIRILEKRQDVYLASPNIYESADAVPNDTKYSDQDAFDTISLPDAWNMSTGSNEVVVGIIDTGIDASHPDLQGVVDATLSRSYLGDSDDPLEDVDGHGTHIAGIIGAKGDNGIGVTGVCWNVKLVSFKVGETTDYFDIEYVIDAIRDAADLGIDILNYSGGGTNHSEYVEWREEAIEEFPGLFVCSAGNEGSNNNITPYYPSNHNLPNLISVGASNDSDQKKSDSNYGKTTVDIFAPGSYILSCYPTDMCISGEHDTVHSVCESNGFHYMGGTSMATPMVVGVAALMLANNPDLKPHEIKCMIMRNVDVIYNQNGNNVFGDYCVSGGRLNAYAALSDSTQGHLYEVVHSNGDTGGHVSVCQYCEYICSSTEEFGFISTDSAITHRIVCDTCGYYYTGNHSFTIYKNIGTTIGHRVTCRQCGYNYVEHHSWKGVIGKFICTDCGCESSTPVVGPGIMSRDEEEKEE